MGTWELIGIFFQKFSWCSTTEPNFIFLAYLYLEILAAVKNDPGLIEPGVILETEGSVRKIQKGALLHYEKV